MKVLKNVNLYGEITDITVENGKISGIGKTDLAGVDFEKNKIYPGLIDIHIHGCNLADATDGNENSAAEMSKWLAKNGITSFCPTTMTLPVDTLKKCFGYISKTMGNEEGAYIHGINMEGPFIAPEKKGAQDAAHILKPDFNVF